MNPRTPTGPYSKSHRLFSKIKQYDGFILTYKAYKENFEKWIKNRVCEKHAQNILSYLNRFCDEIRDIGDVIRIVDSSTSRKNMVIALRNFINFLEEIGTIDPEFANKLRKPLKVVRSNVDAFIPSDKDIINAYKNLTRRNTELFSRFCYTQA